MLIRPARLDDYDAVSRLVSCREEMFLAFPTASWPFTVKHIHRLAEQRADLSVATEEDKLLGFANLYDIRPGEWAFIGNLIVARQFRGEGIGKQILDYMLERVFKVRDIPEARLSVFTDNRPALTLYRKFGFRTYASEQRGTPRNEIATLQHMRLSR